MRNIAKKTFLGSFFPLNSDNLLKEDYLCKGPLNLCTSLAKQGVSDAQVAQVCFSTSWLPTCWIP